MSLSKVKKIHSISTPRIKCLDFHPTKPLLLAAFYSGDGAVIDCNNGNVVKKLNVHPGIPLRTCKWLPNGNMVFGGDKFGIFFYSPTGKLVHEVPNAHDAYVRSIAPHPNEQFLLSCGDDFKVKLWDISDNGCKLIRVFKGHRSLVMDVKWYPRDLTTFASCALEGNMAYWEISSETPRYMQKISSKCVNSISFSNNNDRTLMATASDDHTVQIWDFQARSLITTLEGHEDNVSKAEFHPTRPILLTTSEDGISYIWSTITYKKEGSLRSVFEKGWAIAFSNDYPYLAIGYNKGLWISKFLNNGVPMSLDHSGKIVIAQGTEVLTSSIKNIGEIVDGSELTLAWKEVLANELTPIEIQHSPNGKFIAITSDGEWNIYTSLGFKSKSFGKGMKFVWSFDSNNYAVLNITGSISTFNSFKESDSIKVFAKKIWGGELIGACVNEGTEFYDWDTHKIICRIETKAKDIKWYGDLVALQTKETIYILQYNRENIDKWTPEVGYEDSFSLLSDISCKSSSIFWVNGILFFTENTKIVRYVAGVLIPTATLKTTPTIIGYLPRENLLVLADQKRKIIGVSIPNSLIEFESEISNDEEPDPSLIPEKYFNRCAKFLKQIGKLDLALEMTTDKVMKFDIALELNKLDIAKDYAIDTTMWNKLAHAALNKNNIELAILSLKKCKDLSTLLIIYKAKNKFEEMKELVELAINDGQYNVAFNAALLTNQKEKCVDILLNGKQYSEAALFARSYCPSKTSECVKLWKQNIENSKVADSLADPEEFPNMFDELIEE